MATRPKLLRVTTVPISLKLLLRGQLTFMQQHGFDVVAISADGPEVESIKSEGIPHETVNMSRKITPFRDLFALVALVRLILKHKPTIVHTHTPKAGLLGMMAAWITRVPVRLHTVAGLPLIETQGIKRSVLWITERITYAAATKVYVNSSKLLSFIKDNGVATSKLMVLGKGSSNGIDAEFFSVAPDIQKAADELRLKFKAEAEECVFSFVGRVVKAKGIDELLEAFVTVSKDKPSRLFLIGPFEDELDPLSEASMEIIRNNPRVSLLGYLDDVRPALLASDVFVFPSYREGFPNVVMQACCMELPCIVTDINGSNEIIVHEKSGIIVPPKDARALASAMRRLSGDPGTRKSMGKIGRSHVASNFNQTYIWETLLKEYQSLL